MKIAHIVGNRPQFIKLALLHDELQKRAAGQSLIIHTGQHFDTEMSGVFFGELLIPHPDHQLAIHSLSHNDMIGNMLIAIDPILARERPDAVIVYGDTNTSLAGALAAKKRNIPLAHIEAGVRTGKEDMPEESNRYLADRMADWNFACTPLGRENLIREGFSGGDGGSGGSGGGERNGVGGGGERNGGGGGGERSGGGDRREGGGRSGGGGEEGGADGGGSTIRSEVFVCGDLMLDAALRFAEQARRSEVLRGIFGEGKDGEKDRKSANEIEKPPFILATIHRAENTEDPEALGQIIEALNILHDRIPVVFPMHPRTRLALEQAGIVPRFIISPPLGYLDMLSLVQACRSVITDSGGLSREAFFFRKPALVVMHNPFWPELFSHGRCLPSAAVAAEIVEKQKLLDTLNGPWTTEIFGDGHAAARISTILLEKLAAKGGGRP